MGRKTDRKARETVSFRRHSFGQDRSLHAKPTALPEQVATLLVSLADYITSARSKFRPLANP